MKKLVNNWLLPCLVMLAVFYVSPSNADQAMSSQIPILVFTTEDGSLKLRGDGEVFKKDKLIPVITYWTDCNGTFMNFGVYFSPFVKFNPVILDFSKAKPSKYAIASQGDDKESSNHNTLLNTLQNKLFYVDDEYVVYPIPNDKDARSWVSEHSSTKVQTRYISIGLYSDSAYKNILPLSDLNINTSTKNGGKLTIQQAQDNIVVSSIPREAMKLVVSDKSGKKWDYMLFPAFRGVTPDVIEYRISNVGLKQ